MKCSHSSHSEDARKARYLCNYNCYCCRPLSWSVDDHGKKVPPQYCENHIENSGLKCRLVLFKTEHTVRRS